MKQEGESQFSRRNSSSVSCRLEDKQVIRLDRQCRRHNLTRGEYIRIAILNELSYDEEEKG